MSVELNHLRSRAETLRSGLVSRLQEIGDSGFPTETPGTLFKLLLRYLEEQKNVIESCADADKLRLMAQAVLHFGNYLAFLENAKNETTPSGLVQVIEDIFKNLSPDARLIVSPQPNYNYQISDIQPTLVRAIRASIGVDACNRLTAGAPTRLNLIEFPQIDRDNILVHAIFGHEIGHPIADEFLKTQQASAAYLTEQKKYIGRLNTLIKPKLDQIQDPASKLDLNQKYINLLLELVRRGLQELVSDAVGILIFGPSALFAYFDVLNLSPLDSLPCPPEYYPPSRYRLRVSKKLLDELGYTDELSKSVKGSRAARQAIAAFLQEINNITSIDTDLKAIDKDPIVKLAYEWMQTSLTDAIDYAKKQVATVTYSPATISNEIPELLERLSIGLPPNEKYRYPKTELVNWRSSILSGWIYYIGCRHYSDAKELHIYSGRNQKLFEVVLRGIEYVMLQSRYPGVH